MDKAVRLTLLRVQKRLGRGMVNRPTGRDEPNDWRTLLQVGAIGSLWVGATERGARRSAAATARGFSHDDH